MGQSGPEWGRCHGAGVGEESLPLTTIRILRDAFDDSDLPFKVDLVVWAEVSEEFRKVIGMTALSL